MAVERCLSTLAAAAVVARLKAKLDAWRNEVHGKMPENRQGRPATARTHVRVRLGSDPYVPARLGHLPPVLPPPALRLAIVAAIASVSAVPATPAALRVAVARFVALHEPAPVNVAVLIARHAKVAVVPAFGVPIPALTPRIEAVTIARGVEALFVAVVETAVQRGPVRAVPVVATVLAGPARVGRRTLSGTEPAGDTEPRCPLLRQRRSAQTALALVPPVPRTSAAVPPPRSRFPVSWCPPSSARPVRLVAPVSPLRCRRSRGHSASSGPGRNTRNSSQKPLRFVERKESFEDSRSGSLRPDEDTLAGSFLVIEETSPMPIAGEARARASAPSHGFCLTSCRFLRRNRVGSQTGIYICEPRVNRVLVEPIPTPTRSLYS